MRDNPLLDATVAGMLTVAAARFPDREAIVATDIRITCPGLYAGACRVARALLALGIGKEDKLRELFLAEPAGGGRRLTSRRPPRPVTSGPSGSGW